MRLKFPASAFPRLAGGSAIAAAPGILQALAPQSEGEIQKAVRAELEAAGCLVVRVNGGLLPRADGGKMRCNEASEGTCSDLLALTPWGVFIAAEVKRPGEEPTDGQSEFLAATIIRGGVGAVVTSIADARAALAEARDLVNSRTM